MFVVDLTINNFVGPATKRIIGFVSKGYEKKKRLTDNMDVVINGTRQ